ncbi:GNAT family N-acetyltransferase [Candidatus Bathyarchaeota archaeon]|nr:GNAT family N-acetyltransferase [Candidatus Bathyarchaeota archaeon]
MDKSPFWLKPRTVQLRDGTRVTLRPEERRDREPVWEMFASLSRESLQYLPIPFTRERVEGWFMEINYDRVLPMLAFTETEGGVRAIASASLGFHNQGYNKHKATFGITVHDDYQGLGLGTIMTEYLIDVAKAKGIKKLELEVLTINERAVKLYERCGYQIEGKRAMNHWNYVLGRYCDDYVMGLVLEP